MKFNLIQLKFLLLFAFLTANAQAAFDEMIVFGDSLSDTGNLASVRGEFPNPPFYLGSRVSNGPVAVEGLAAKLGLSLDASLHLVGGTEGNNYAVAGARAGGESAIDLTTQVGAYLQKVGGVAPEDTLFVMFVGGNDVRDARDLRHNKAKAMIRVAAQSVDQKLRLLIAAGARHILVVNSPDIGTIPETDLIAAATNNVGLVGKARRLSRQFNSKLAAKLRKIERETEVDLVLFDLFAYLHKVINDAGALGYTNIDDACFSTLNGSFNPACEFGQRFDQHLFFDEIHPSARSHERVSRALYAEMPEG